MKLASGVPVYSGSVDGHAVTVSAVRGKPFAGSAELKTTRDGAEKIFSVENGNADAGELASWISTDEPEAAARMRI